MGHIAQRRGGGAWGRHRDRVRIVAVGVVLVGLLAPVASATAAASASAASSPASMTATIQRSEYGIPHITSGSFRGLGFGFGYAFAQDDICVMANDYVTVKAQRSLYFGPTGTYLQGGNGSSSTNLDSDFFWRQVIDSGIVQHLVSEPPPLGPDPRVLQLIDGYVAGYNRYLGDVGGAAGIPDPTCRGAAWVQPISVLTAELRLYQLMIIASQGVDITGIAEAQPPPASSPAASLDAGATARALARNFQQLHGQIGSNAIAVGRAGTRDHTHGLLLGNPHFPWFGTERFYEAQMTIPGVMDAEGAMLYGVPLVLIGHTMNMAWSHTVATAFEFTPYQLTLVPGNPTEYLEDGKPTPMTSRVVVVQVRQSDGSVTKESRTLYSTRYGPMITSLVGIPLPWTPMVGFAMRDANATDVRVANHFLETDMAQSVPQELSILKKYEGIPWVNTIVSDRAGNALYADIGNIPHVTDAEAHTCDTAIGAATFDLVGLPVLDGSRTSCDWGSDRDSVAPGIFGPSHEPYLLRSDYVTNSNDSYWLGNPHHPLTGYARIIGSEGTERSLRTRMGLIQTQQRVDGSDGLGPPGFTLQDMQNADLSDRILSAQLTRDELVSMCESLPGGLAPTSSGVPVAVGDACTVLKAWDLRDNLGSRGGLLFRLFWLDAVANTTESSTTGGPDCPAVFSVCFSAVDPVNTPNTLDQHSPVVQTAFGDAIKQLNDAHVPLNATLGSQQGVSRNGTFIPIPGGNGDPNGELNAIYPGFVSGQGFTDVTDGSSYIQVVTWHDQSSCPDVRTILTYSLSSNPASPHYTDQTELFSKKQWVTERFCPSAVASSALQTTTISTS